MDNTVAKRPQFKLLNLNIYQKFCDPELHHMNNGYIYFFRVIIEMLNKILKYYENTPRRGN